MFFILKNIFKVAQQYFLILLLCLRHIVLRLMYFFTRNRFFFQDLILVHCTFAFEMYLPVTVLCIAA